MPGYTSRELLPGVHHIFDPLGVHLTLLVGQERALLFDTGYGAYDLPGFLRSLTSKPLTVMLSHGHHDHALGAMHFENCLMRSEDLPVFLTYTYREQRERVLERAELPEQAALAYMNTPIPQPADLALEEIDLGGLSCLPIPVPGHTPGSVALLVREHQLLLLGDSWNPQTWLFFPEALPVRTYAEHFKQLMAQPFKHALAPHFSDLLPVRFLRQYAAGLSETGFASAKPVTVPGHEQVATLAFEPLPGYPLIFRD